jgi:phosphopantothenate synthetase
MCDEIWIAIQKLADAILQFDKLDREEATSIVKSALNDKEITHSALSWYLT